MHIKGNIDEVLHDRFTDDNVLFVGGNLEKLLEWIIAKGVS